MSIRHNINITGDDIERLYGAADTELKKTNDPECRAYWHGVASVLELLGMLDPPGYNAFVAKLKRRLDEVGGV